VEEDIETVGWDNQEEDKIDLDPGKKEQKDTLVYTRAFQDSQTSKTLRRDVLKSKRGFLRRTARASRCCCEGSSRKLCLSLNWIVWAWPCHVVFTIIVLAMTVVFFC
jgi:hypothetical protein